MAYTARTWPIAAALLQFPGVDADGVSVQDFDGEEWQKVFQEVADAGFSSVDLTDCWVRPGDLSSARVDELAPSANSRPPLSIPSGSSACTSSTRRRSSRVSN